MSCCKLMKLLKSNDHGNCIHKELSNSQFAAIDSHIDFMELPMLSINEPFGSQVECHACIKPEFSLEASIISIIATYRMFYNIVIFVSSSNVVENVVNSIPNESRNMVIVAPSSVSRDSFRIYSKNPDRCITTSESDMIKFVKSILGDMSLTIYTCPEWMGYPCQFQSSKYALWITTCSSTLRMIGTGGTRIMPMFYSRPTVNSVLHVNAGTAITTVGGLGPGLQQKLYSVTGSTLNAVSKGGMCYFCAYMQKCHDVLCKGSSNCQEIVVDLCKDFIPNVDDI